MWVARTVSEHRTKNYFRQVKEATLFKGLAVACSFFAVPLMIRYLGQEQYGIWSTLLSLMSWVVFFDLGVGNGLRNKLAESMAKMQLSDAAGYISSGYTLVGIISVAVFGLVAIVSFFIPWQMVFNTKALNEVALRDAVVTLAFFIFLNFWLGLINQILDAVQKTSRVVVGQFISNALGLLVVLLLTQSTKSSVAYLIIGYGISVVVANLFLSVWFFRKQGKLIPKPLFEQRYLRPILSVGMQFLIIQIAGLFIFSTDKILITQLLGPQHVTQYDVVYKLFSVVTLLHGLLIAPVWSAYTDAYHRADFRWLNTMLRRQLLLFVFMAFVTVGIGLGARVILCLWIGESVAAPPLLIVSMGALIVISVWNNVFAYFLNGVGKPRIQVYAAVIGMLVNVPMSILLVKHFDAGVSAIVWATCLSLLTFSITGPIQVFSILAKARH